MKPSTLILFVSLAANIAFIAAFLPSRTSAPAASSAMATSTATSSSEFPGSTATARPTALHPSSPTANTLHPATDSLWTKLATDDFDTLAARLRATGFTYRQVRAIILVLAGKKFSDARAEIRGKDDQPYWKPYTYFNYDDPEKRAKEQQLSQQESALYRKYFNGPEALAEDEEMADAMRQRYGNLPLEKLQTVTRIQADYDELQQKVHAAMSARARQELTPEDRKQLSLLASEREHDIQQALTPGEFDEYLLRESPTAQSLRNALGLLRPTETEYKTLFALRRAIDQQFSPLDRDENTAKARSDALKNQEPRIIAALGPDRYADYKQLMESGSDKVTRLMARLDLPLSTVGKINTVRDDIIQRAATIRSDTTLSATDRTVRLSALAQEAQSKLSTTLGGPRGYEAYADMKGDWLRDLAKP